MASRAVVNVGAMEPINGIHGMMLEFGRRSLAGSIIGDIAETQEVVDYCIARSIKAGIELIRPDQINQAFDRVVKKDVRLPLCHRHDSDQAGGRRN